MPRKLTVFVSIVAALSVQQAVAQSSTTDVRIDAGQATNGSQNLYLCNDETGAPVLMQSCPDFEPRYDDVVYNPPYPPVIPGADLDTNGNPVDEYGNVIGGQPQQRTVPPTDVITFQTAPVGDLGDAPPVFSLSGKAPTGGTQSFGDDDRSGGGGGGVR